LLRKEIATHPALLAPLELNIGWKSLGLNAAA
jgi:hypothetical protein